MEFKRILQAAGAGVLAALAAGIMTIPGGMLSGMFGALALGLPLAVFGAVLARVLVRDGAAAQAWVAGGFYAGGVLVALLDWQGFAWALGIAVPGAAALGIVVAQNRAALGLVGGVSFLALLGSFWVAGELPTPRGPT